MERPSPGWHPETLPDATARRQRLPLGGLTRGDGDLTNLDWLHENKNLLSDLQLGKETEPSGAEETDPARLTEGRGGCPAKPPYSFSSLIFMAIEGSRSKCLPVKDIYSWILDTFPYYKGASLGWKNSVRHNLSLSKCFRKVQTDSAKIEGKGSLWCVEPEYRHILIDGLRKNCCGQQIDSPSQDSLCQILQDPETTELRDCFSCETDGGTAPSTRDEEGPLPGHSLLLTTDHNYSILNIQVLPGEAGGGSDMEQLLLTSGPAVLKEAADGGGRLEFLLFADQSGSRLDWCFEALGLVEVDSEVREAAGSLLHLAGVQY